MGRGGKTKTSFKPGQSGNPNGRPQVPIDLKESRSVNKNEFERVLNKYMYMTGPEINSALKSDSLPMMELIVAKILAKAFNEGDQRRLEFVIDRLIGKAPLIINEQIPNQVDFFKKVSFSEFCIKAGYPPPYAKQCEMLEFAINDHAEPGLLLGARKYGKTDYVTVLGVAYDIYLNGTATSNLIITKSKIRNTAIMEEIANALKANGVELEKENASCVRVKGMIGKDHSAEALTIRSSFRGRHPKRALMDDPVTEEDVSAAQRALVERKYNELVKLTKNVRIIGQPAHAFDLYAKLRPLLKRKLEVPWGTIPELDDDLEAMKLAGVDPGSIEMSYHLRVPVTGNNPFGAIKYIDKFENGDCVAFIDPSDGGDYTAVSIVRGYMNGVMVQGRAWKLPWYNCLEEMLKEFKKRGVRRICFETNHSGTQPLDQLRSVFGPLGIGVVGVHSDTNKHATIMNAGSFAHLIHLSKESDQAYTGQVVQYEYGAEFDDSPDSLARCLVWMGLVKAKK